MLLLGRIFSFHHRLYRIDIIAVFVGNVVREPAHQHHMHLASDVFALGKAQSKIRNAPNKKLMHLFVHF